MPDENAKPEAPAAKEINLRELHIGNAPRVVATMMKQPACIVITRDAAGVIQMNSHGVDNPAVANEMLSVSIYCNLRDHYDGIRQGNFGEEAQEVQLKLDELSTAPAVGGVQ